MDIDLERIHGGKIETLRGIPGTDLGEPETVRYVSTRKGFTPRKLFRTVVEYKLPVVVQNGAAILEECVITTPDGVVLHAIMFSGDLPEWRHQIETAASELGLLSAQIVAETIVLSDGRSYAISDCDVRVD